MGSPNTINTTTIANRIKGKRCQNVICGSSSFDDRLIGQKTANQCIQDSCPKNAFDPYGHMRTPRDWRRRRSRRQRCGPGRRSRSPPRRQGPPPAAPPHVGLSTRRPRGDGGTSSSPRARPAACARRSTPAVARLQAGRSIRTYRSTVAILPYLSRSCPHPRQPPTNTSRT